MMKNSLIYKIALLLSLPAAAVPKTVLLPEFKVDPAEYQSVVAALPEFQTPSEKILQSNRRGSSNSQLINNFAAAQKVYLEGDLERAQNLFRQIYEQRLEKDLSQSDRKIYAMAVLRLAQLAQTDRDDWLTKSLEFDEELDVRFFPPPLIERRKLLAEKTDWVQLSWPGADSDWPALIVNGKKCEPKLCRLPRGHVARVQFISNVWILHTATLQAEKILSYRPPQAPWLEGNCAAYQMSEQVKILGQTKAYFSKECLSYDGDNSLSWAKPTAAPLIFKEADPPKLPRRNIIKSPWFWGAIGAVALSAVIYHQESRDRKKESDTTYGY